VLGAGEVKNLTTNDTNEHEQDERMEFRFRRASGAFQVGLAAKRPFVFVRVVRRRTLPLARRSRSQRL
jgi:hypothetical protein